MSTAAAGEHDGARIRPTLTVADIQVRMFWIADDAERKLTYSAATGADLSTLEAYRLAGFSQLHVDAAGNYFCDIYAAPPKRVNDKAVMTLGHELLHCLLGNYHE